MSTVETKALEADFAKTFSAFKTANDQRLAEIEAKQTADPVSEDKVARLDAALEAQSKSIARLAQSLGSPVATADTESKTAWSAYIRHGETAGLEGKSVTSTDGDGTFIAPVETEARIDRVMEETTAFRRIATVRKVSTGLFRKPVSAGGANSGWAGESDTRIETQAPNLSLIDFPTGELYAMPAATQALLDDSITEDISDYQYGWPLKRWNANPGD